MDLGKHVYNSPKLHAEQHGGSPAMGIPTAINKYGNRRLLTSYKPMTAAIDCPTRSAAASISRSPRWA